MKKILFTSFSMLLISLQAFAFYGKREGTAAGSVTVDDVTYQLFGNYTYTYEKCSRTIEGDVAVADKLVSSRTKRDLIIPEKVKDSNGKEYKVVSIGEQFFYNNKNSVKAMVIPGTVEVLETFALEDNTEALYVLNMLPGEKPLFCYRATRSNGAFAYNDGLRQIYLHRSLECQLPNYGPFYNMSNDPHCLYIYPEVGSLPSACFGRNRASYFQIEMRRVNALNVKDDVFKPIYSGINLLYPYGTKDQFEVDPWKKYFVLHEMNGTSRVQKRDQQEDLFAILERIEGGGLQFSLTIVGSGEMRDFTPDEAGDLETPWTAYKNNLDVIYLDKDLKYIGENAFSGVHTGAIVCDAPNPPKVGKDAFKDMDPNTPIFVHNDNIDAYKNADGWKYFKKFVVNEITIRPDDKGKIEGTADPSLSWSVVKGKLYPGSILNNLNIWRDNGDKPGVYTIHTSSKDVDNPDYKITHETAEFRIIPKESVFQSKSSPRQDKVGFKRDCYVYTTEKNEIKYYDAKTFKELNERDAIEYAKQTFRPDTKLEKGGWELKDEADYSGYKFHNVSETNFKRGIDPIRTVSYTMDITNFSGLRLFFYKSASTLDRGKYKIAVKINNKDILVINDYDAENIDGVREVALPETIQFGDIITFQVDRTVEQKEYSEVKFAVGLDFLTRSEEYQVGIKADNKVKVEGHDDPNLTWSIYRGKEQGDDKIEFIRLSRTPGENVGKYDIFVTQLDLTKNPKYSIKFRQGIFNIVPKSCVFRKKVNPTCTSIGLAQDCYIDTIAYRVFDENGVELSAAKTILFPEQKGIDINTNNSMWQTAQSNELEGVKFYRSARIEYATDKFNRNEQKVTFKITDDNLSVARLKWAKSNPQEEYGRYDVAIFVNEQTIYEVKDAAFAGSYSLFLPNLKKGDAVTVVTKGNRFPLWSGTTAFCAALEYTTTECEPSAVEGVSAVQCSVYPTVTSDFVTIDSEVSVKDVLVIEDGNGKIHNGSLIDGKVVDLRGFATGRYDLKLQFETEIQTFRVIKY